MWVNPTQHKPIYKGVNGLSQGEGGEGTMKSRTLRAGEPAGGGFIAVS